MLINNGKEFLKLSFQALSLQQWISANIVRQSVCQSNKQPVSQSVKLLVSQCIKEPVLGQSVSQMFNMLFCHVSNAS